VEFSLLHSDQHVKLITRFHLAPWLRMRGTTPPARQHKGNLIFTLGFTENDSTWQLFVPTFLRLRPVTDVFHLKIHETELQSCYVLVT